MARAQPALDGLRSLAAAAVVALHAAALVLTGPARVGSPDWWAANLLDSATRWCVPVFVMISAALLLGREEAPGRFLGRRLLRLLPLLLVWTLAYLGLQAATQPGWQPAAIWPALLRGQPYYHLWYLFMLPGLYLLMLPLRRLLQGLSVGGVRVIACLLLPATLLIWCLPPAPSAWLRAGAFLPACVAGFLLHRACHGPGAWRCPAWLALAVFAGSSAGIALMAAAGHPEAAYDYANPLVLLQAVAVFAWGLQGMGRVLPRLAPLSLGIYLVHPALLLLLQPWLLQGGAVLLLPLAALAFLLSALVTAGLFRLPGSSRWMA